jgi:hypothetical protein
MLTGDLKAMNAEVEEGISACYGLYTGKEPTTPASATPPGTNHLKMRGSQAPTQGSNKGLHNGG